MRSWALAAALLHAASLATCSRGEPPTPDGSPSVAYPDLPSPAPKSPPAASFGAPAPPASQPAPVGPLDSGAPDPSHLPQTREKPTATGDAFDARVRALWDGIVSDDPERSMPMFFPLGAYQQVKDVPNPAADWRHRLVAAYAHDIHALHAQLGSAGASATLVALDVPEAHARWVEPGEEYNKIGYYRVFGSRLRFQADGATRTFEVKSLISWRGEWYVVHVK
jgi:hypothetical protein